VDVVISLVVSCNRHNKICLDFGLLYVMMYDDNDGDNTLNNGLHWASMLQLKAGLK